MKKRILILGGTGFIGSKLVEFYLKKKFIVFTISVNKKKFKKHKNLKRFFFDISDSKKCIFFFKKYNFTYVVNLAGYVNHQSFYSENNKIIESHFLGTLNSAYNINRKYLKKYLYIGSGDEYGLSKSPQKETIREKPTSLYSFAKTASTHFLQMINRSENFPSTIIRIFLTYGPGQKINRFIPQIINGCLENKKFKTSSGKQIRDFCYIDDLIEGINATLVSSKTLGQVYNIGSNKPLKIKNVVKLIKALIGSGIPEYGKFKFRKNENMNLYPSTKKITRDTGWRPKTTLHEGLINTIRYIKKKNEIT